MNRVSRHRAQRYARPESLSQTARLSSWSRGAQRGPLADEAEALTTGSASHPAVIGAGEIAQYVFCRRAWWLRRVGGCQVADAGVLDDGLGFHARHGRRVATAQHWQRVGYVLLGIGVLIGIWMLWLTSGTGW